MFENNSGLIACCGLYCGCCKAYVNKKCPGCAKNEKATWCATRKCAVSKSIPNCSECKDFSDFHQCKKLNNIISKLFGLFLNSDRIKALEKLKELGPENFAKYMSENKLQTIKRR